MSHAIPNIMPALMTTTLPPPIYLASENYATAMIETGQLLQRFGSIWRSRPFVEEQTQWQGEYPRLYQAILALSDEQLQDFDDETKLLPWIQNYLPDSEALTRWDISAFSGRVSEMEKFADVGIKGAKVEQVTAFAANLGAVVGPLKRPILDWCSGKGHLAKQLHFVTEQPINCLEFNPELCQSGTKEALKLGYPLQFFVQDVLQPIPPLLLDNIACHTALHACGDLHLQMINTAVASGAEYIALSPCCYHLSNNERYKALSPEGKSLSLSLDRTELKLAVSQTVTAGRRVRRLRQRELLWRTAFDLLLRKLFARSYYTPTPSMAKKWFAGSFVDFCRHMAFAINVELPEHFEQAELLALAQVKCQRMARLEKARLAFRQTLEYYLVLDRALLLQSQGYQVSLSLFCQSHITPRNILIVASKMSPT